MILPQHSRSVAAGWTDVGKAYLRLDDRDSLDEVRPSMDALTLVSGNISFLQ